MLSPARIVMSTKNFAAISSLVPPVIFYNFINSSKTLMGFCI